MKKLIQYLLLMRAHRPVGTILLLWPTLWALWIAGAGAPNLQIAMLFCLGVFVTRSAGCVINDYADRHFDGAVKRTQQRPIVTGKVSPREALVVFAVLMLIALAIVLNFNYLTIGLAVIAAFIAVLYPFTKRFFSAPQLVLGIAFACAVPMAFAAQIEELPLVCWLIFLAAILWPVIYDTMYAMVDREDDVPLGIHSTALLFGEFDRLWIGIFQGLFILCLMAIGRLANLTFSYYIALILTTILFGYQQHLIKNRDPALCFKAFMNNQWVGLVIFIGILLSYQ